MPHTTELLTAREVAEAFRVSASTVSRWRRDGTIPSFKVGGVLRFRRADVEALLNPEPVK